jgi:Fic family protein
VAPPDLPGLVRSVISRYGPDRYNALAQRALGPAPGGRYRHWDTFRHAPPLDDFDPEEQWVAVKMARRSLYRELPLADARGIRFRYALPNIALEMIHRVDRNAAGNIQGTQVVTDSSTRDTYLFKSLVEEAITSSQLEGASTTRKVAKAMIREGRAPRTRSERMILNNYHAMHHVRSIVNEPMTPGAVFALQRILTEGTLDEPDAAGRFRRDDEHIVIEDEAGTILHTPPPAHQLQERLERMCVFANALDDDEFIPPVVRSILLHFWLAYDHPFVDGNGRTARALFYWSMARQGYWLCEYVSISRILRRARGQYARAFLYTETDDNDVTYFLLYQLRVLLRAIDELHEYLRRKVAEARTAEDLVQRVRVWRDTLNPRQVALINHALRNPDARYTVASHRVSHGVSYETARSDLTRLRELGALEQRKSGRAFVFVPVKDLREHLQQGRKPPVRRRRR